ncbi:MAG: hypothetical protein KDK39_17025 [Leptospiraceae bacterium]|nr:hypothetical protein [Leptospiraceae bacterium]
MKASPAFVHFLLVAGASLALNSCTVREDLLQPPEQLQVPTEHNKSAISLRIAPGRMARNGEEYLQTWREQQSPADTQDPALNAANGTAPGDDFHRQYQEMIYDQLHKHPMEYRIRRILNVYGGFQYIVPVDQQGNLQDYHIDIIIHTNTDLSMAGMLLSAFTLYLIPFQSGSEQEFEVTVYHRKSRLKTYTYKENLEMTFGLIALVNVNSEEVVNQVYDDLGQRIVADLQKDNIIPNAVQRSQASERILFTGAIVQIKPSSRQIRIFHPSAGRLLRPGQILKIRRGNSSQYIDTAKITLTSYTFANATVVSGNAAAIQRTDTVVLLGK